MPAVPGLLALLEGFFDTADEADVFIDGVGEGEGVLLGLAGVEIADAELYVGEGG